MIGVIVLASGFSKRMGEPKLLLPWNNKTILRNVVETVLKIENTRIKVIVNPSISELKHEISDLPVDIVDNHRASEGMSSSVKNGIELMERDITAAMILLGDQPRMTKEIIEQVIQEYRKSPCLIVQASFQGKPGHPVIFNQVMFEELLTISGDQGAKSIIEKYRSQRKLVHFDLPPVKDIDTKEDYFKLLRNQA